jgi:hypothetical protein
MEEDQDYEQPPPARQPSPVWRPASPLSLSSGLVAWVPPERYQAPFPISGSVKDWVHNNFSTTAHGSRESMVCRHPRLFIGRDLLSRAMQFYSTGEALQLGLSHATFIDVGSNARVMHDLYGSSWSWWAMMPSVLPEDEARWQRAIEFTNKCRHKLAECDCVTSICSYVSVNSVFYLDAEEIAAACRQTMSGSFYAVVFAPVPMFGSFHDEATFYLDVSGELVTTVAGNGEEYRHPRRDHIYQSSTGLRAGTLVREVLASCEDHLLLRYSISPVQSVHASPGQWVDLLDLSRTDGIAYAVDHRPPGSGQMKDLDPIMEDLECERVVVVGDGAVMYRSASRRVVLSRTILHAMSAYAAFRVRDSALVRDLTNMARNQYGRINMPPALRSDAVVASVTLAAALRLEQEVGHLGAFLARWKSMIAYHTRLLSFSPGCRVPLWAAVAILLASVVLLVVVAVYDPLPEHAATITWAVLVVAFVAWLWCLWGASTFRRAASAMSWSRAVTAGAVESVVEPLLPPKTEYEPNGVLKPVVRMRADFKSQVTRNEDPRPATALMRHWGVAFDKHVPTYHASTQESELNGLQGRVGVPTPEIDWRLFDEYVQFVRSRPWYLRLAARADGIAREATAFDRWLDGTKYNATWKHIIREARRDVDTAGWQSEWNRRSAFVKVELVAGKRDLEGTQASNPRIIMAGTPQVLATLGPFCAALLRAFKAEFDYKAGNHITVAIGRTAEYLGEWAHHCELWGGEGVNWLENDFVRLDAHYVSPHRLFWVDCLAAWGATNLECECAFGQEPRGYSHHGVAFRTSDGLCSGGPDTSLAGTFLNFATHEFVNSKLGVEQQVLVGGDDGAMAQRTAVGEPQLRERVELFRRLGFPVETVVRPSLAHLEFYSKLFWPVRGGSYVLGAKPGRVLSKIGWTLSGPGRMSPAAVYQCLGQDAHHVPFLNVFLESTKHLVTGPVKYGRDFEYATHTGKAHDVDEVRTWAFVAERYGLTSADSAAFRAYLVQRVKRVPVVVPSRVVDLLAAVDVGDKDVDLV